MRRFFLYVIVAVIVLPVGPEPMIGSVISRLYIALIKKNLPRSRQWLFIYYFQRNWFTVQLIFYHSYIFIINSKRMLLNSVSHRLVSTKKYTTANVITFTAR